jgi:hypothetical protein
MFKFIFLCLVLQISYAQAESNVNPQNKAKAEVKPYKPRNILLTYDTPYGEWHGEAEFKVITKESFDQIGHVFNNLDLKIDQRGDVSGKTINGCVFSGSSKPTVSSSIAIKMIITTTNCPYDLHNGIYSATLFISDDKNAQFKLSGWNNSHEIPSFISIASTMQRPNEFSTK